MPEIDDELIARALRWCADAGRQATAAAVRDALAPLSWDELLAARALLADTPPARPLGPLALADLARGALPDVAAEREREGRYGAGGDALPPPPAGAARAPRGKRGAKVRSAAGPIVRRARDRVEPAHAAPAPLPSIDVLHESEGRTTLERLVRERGARRAAIVAAIAAGWRRGDGSAPGASDLDALLDAHGLARGFARRERDEALHTLRAASGLKRRAAAALGLTPEALDEALERLGATAEAEAIREARRRELRKRDTLSERVRLATAEVEALSDLGLLSEIEADLRARLPEHVRALRTPPRGDVAPALARSLDVGEPELRALAARLGFPLAAPAAWPSGRDAGAARPRPPARTRTGPPSSSRAGPARAGPPRAPRPGAPPARGAARGGGRSAGSRADPRSSRSPGARPARRPGAASAGRSAAPPGKRRGPPGARPPRGGAGPPRRGGPPRPKR